MKIRLFLKLSLFALIAAPSFAGTCRLEKDDIHLFLQNPQELFEFLANQGCTAEVFILPGYDGPRALERISFIYTWDWRGGIAGSAFGECFKKRWAISDAYSCIFPSL